MCLKVPSGKWRPFCLGLNELMTYTSLRLSPLGFMLSINFGHSGPRLQDHFCRALYFSTLRTKLCRRHFQMCFPEYSLSEPTMVWFTLLNYCHWVFWYTVIFYQVTSWYNGTLFCVLYNAGISVQYIIIDSIVPTHFVNLLLVMHKAITSIILGMGSTDVSRRYILRASFIGWAHTHHDHCINLYRFRKLKCLVCIVQMWRPQCQVKIIFKDASFFDRLLFSLFSSIES